MDGNRFDAFAKAMAGGGGISRRRALSGLVGGTLAGALAAVGLGPRAVQAHCPRETPISCGGICVDLRTDPTNCGRCGRICPSDLCYAGRCREECPSGFTSHNGTCLRTCPAGTAVCDGSCVPACRPDQVFDATCACTCSEDSFECGGLCIPSCTALDDCHEVGECDPLAQACTNPVKEFGAECGDDGECCDGVCVECLPFEFVEEDTCSCNECFTADTRIAMADGTSKAIAEILVGDRVLGQDGQVNHVLDLKPTVLGARPLYALNDGAFFVTAEHPFLTETGWKAIDPGQSARRHPELAVGRLAVGDRLLALAGVAVPVGAGGPLLDEVVETRVTAVPLERISAMPADAATPLYNLRVNNNHTYFANDLVVHNK